MPMLNTSPQIASYRFICIEFLCCSLKKPHHIYIYIYIYMTQWIPLKLQTRDVYPHVPHLAKGNSVLLCHERAIWRYSSCNVIKFVFIFRIMLFCGLNLESPTKTRNTVLTVFLSIFFSVLLQALQLRGNFKMFPESPHFWEIQNSTANSATCTSKWLPRANTHFCQRP